MEKDVLKDSMTNPNPIYNIQAARFMLEATDKLNEALRWLQTAGFREEHAWLFAKVREIEERACKIARDEKT
jgi:phosphoenolpyruvate synthase/pyruvate phosphate dikinase